MKIKTSNWLAALTLLEWGGVFVYFYLSGRISLFLHPYFQPWVLVSGLLMVATGGIIFFSGAESCGQGADRGHDPGTGCCGHESGHNHDGGSPGWGKWARVLVLLLPMAGAALFSPDRFGETILQNRKPITTPAELPGSYQLEDTDSPQLIFTSNNPMPVPAAKSKSGKNAEPPGKVKAQAVDIMDLIYTSGVESERTRMEGQLISITGQVALDRAQGLRVGNFGVYQLVIVCCAADARPVSVRINWPGLDPDLRNTDWVKVTGNIHFIPGDQASVPILNATDVSRTDAPPDAVFAP